MKLLCLVLMLVVGHVAAQETPVLSFHQSRYSSTSQTYSVDVRASGRVIYRGGENTRRPPFAVFDVNPTQIQLLIRELDALKLKQGARPGAGVTSADSSRPLDLVYLSNGETKAFTFPHVDAQGVSRSSAVEYRVRELLEQYIPIRQFRCPSWQDHYESKPPKDLEKFPEICSMEKRQQDMVQQSTATELKTLRNRSLAK